MTRFSRRLPIVLSLFALAALPACDASDGGTGNGVCGTSAVGTGSFTATTPSGTFTAKCVTGSFQSGTLSVGGNLGASGASAGVAQEQFTLALPGASAGRAIPLGLTAIATYARLTGAADASNLYTATSGSATVTAVSATAARGTFSFTGRNNAGQTVQITGGSFDLTF